jgi:1-acyl-sn-glycerol-3-phosphate acyltransferase
MLNFLPPLLVGIIATLFFCLNVLFWPMLVFVFSLLKFLLPVPPLRRLFDKILLWFAENWVSCNSLWMRLTQKNQWDVQGLNDLNYDGWYLVSSNHQSWVDIFVLQHLLGRRIPLMKFFMKSQLIWVPIMCLAWWALDFPFLHRHSA